jgi:hypothetical protein
MASDALVPVFRVVLIAERCSRCRMSTPTRVVFMRRRSQLNTPPLGRPLHPKSPKGERAQPRRPSQTLRRQQRQMVRVEFQPAPERMVRHQTTAGIERLGETTTTPSPGIASTGGTTSTTAAAPTTTTVVVTPPSSAPVPETVGGDTGTYADFENAGGTTGPTIPGGTTVDVACRVQGWKAPDGDT